MKSDKKSGIFRLEQEVVTQCGISRERFRKVRGNQWENIYQKIAEKYADKTKIWKNGRLYNLEILYDKATNAIWHFKYY